MGKTGSGITRHLTLNVAANQTRDWLGLTTAPSHEGLKSKTARCGRAATDLVANAAAAAGSSKSTGHVILTAHKSDRYHDSTYSRGTRFPKMWYIQAWRTHVRAS